MTSLCCKTDTYYSRGALGEIPSILTCSQCEKPCKLYVKAIGKSVEPNV